MKSQSQKYHQKLAEYFHAKDYFVESIEKPTLHVKQFPSSPQPVNYRKVVELPWQRLTAAKLSNHWEEVVRLFTNLVFIDAKSEAGMVFDLADEFSQVLTTLPVDDPGRIYIHLLGEAIQREIHFIDAHTNDYPQGLFQCLWNLCWWSNYKKEDEVTLENCKEQPFASRLLAIGRLKEKRHPGFVWLKSLRPPENPVGCGQRLALRGRGTPIAYSAASSRLACTNIDRDIEIWDLTKLRLLNTIPFHIYHTMVYSTAIALNPNGKVLAQATNNSHELRIIDVESGKLIWRRTDVFDTTIDFLSFTLDGRELICVGGVYFCVLDANSGETLNCLHWEHHKKIVCLPNHTKIASISKTKRRVLSFDGSLEIALPQSAVELVSIAIAPDCSKVATGNDDGEIEIFSLADSKCIRKLVWSDEKIAVSAISFTNFGKGLIIGRNDGVVQILDSEGMVISENRFHRNKVNEAVLASTEDVVITASYDSLAAWSAPIIQKSNKVWREDHNKPVQGITYSEDDMEIASVSDSELKLWNSETGRNLGTWPLPLLAPTLHLSGDLDDRFLVRYNKAKRRIIIATHLNPSSNGIRLVMIKLPDASIILRIEEAISNSVANKDIQIGYDVPESSDFFITWSKKTLKVWDIVRAKIIRELKHSSDNGIINCGAVSRDGRFVATGGDDGLVIIWSLETGSYIGIFSGHQNPVYLIKWSQSGKFIVSVSNDGFICVFDAVNQYELNRFQHRHTILNESSAVEALAISDDEKYLVSVGKPKPYKTSKLTLAKVWDLKEGKLIEEINGDGILYEKLAECLACEFNLSANEFGVVVRHSRSGHIIGRLPDRFADISAMRHDGLGFTISSGQNINIYKIVRGAPQDFEATNLDTMTPDLGSQRR
jgi:WD40 repeat protein